MVLIIIMEFHAIRKSRIINQNDASNITLLIEPHEGPYVLPMMFDGRHYFQGMHEYDANAISLPMEIDKVCLVNYICLILLTIINRVTNS
jgi:hypothetical protein